MSAAPRFVPLLCPDCGGDVAGRARDVVGFCGQCRGAFIVDADGLHRIEAARATVLPEGNGPLLHAPFWVRGVLVAPAFLTSRPLLLTRTASRLAGDWGLQHGVEPPFPLGARIGPGALDDLARLAGIGIASGRPALVSVPLRRTGHRWRMAGLSLELVPDDVAEGEQLASCGAGA